METSDIIGIVVFLICIVFIGLFLLISYNNELKKKNKKIDEFNKRFKCHLNYDDNLIDGLCNIISVLQAEINTLEDILISSSEEVIDDGKNIEDK